MVTLTLVLSLAACGGRGPSPGEQASEVATALQGLATDPVALVSGRASAKVRENVAEFFSPGSKVSPDVQSWAPDGPNKGTMVVTVQPPNQDPRTITVVVIVEDSDWKIFDVVDDSSDGSSRIREGVVYADYQSMDLSLAPDLDPDLLLADSVQWRGGMIGGMELKEQGESDYTGLVWGWVPGATQFKACSLALWNDNEYPLESFDVAATTNGQPAVGVVYAATTRASGLNPEETRFWYQTLSFETCQLGSRVALTAELVDTDTDGYPAFVAASADVLGVVVRADTVVGLDPKTGKAVWTRTFESEDSDESVSCSVTSLANEYNGVFTLSCEPSWGYSDKTELISVKDGSVVASAVNQYVSDHYNVGAPTLELGGGRYIYSKTEGNYSDWAKDGARWELFAHVGTRDTPIKGGSAEGPYYLISDGKGGMVLVGIFKGESGTFLGYIGDEDTIVEVISPERVDKLDLEILTASNGKIYIETIEDSLVVGLDGELIDEPAFDSDQWPYCPVDERYIGDTLWTLWSSSCGWTGGVWGSVVVRDGFTPKE